MQNTKQDSVGYDAWWFVACYVVEQCDLYLFTLLFQTVPSLMRLKLANAADPTCHGAKMYRQLRVRFGFLAHHNRISSVSTWTRTVEKTGEGNNGENGREEEMEKGKEHGGVDTVVPLKYDFLVATSAKDSLFVFNAKTMRRITACKFDGVIINVNWSPSGRIIACVFGCQVAFWNPWSNWCAIRRFDSDFWSKRPRPNTCSWSPDGLFFALACDHKITIFDIITVKERKKNWSFSLNVPNWELVNQMRWIAREQSYALEATCHHFAFYTQAVTRLLVWHKNNSSWQNSHETVIDFKKANDKQVVTSLFSQNQSRLAYLLRKVSHETSTAKGISNATLIDITPVCSPSDEGLTLVVNNRRGKMFSLPLRERVDSITWSPDSRFLALVLSGYETREDSDASNVFLPEITFTQRVQVWEVDSQTLFRTFIDATIVAFSNDSKTVFYNENVLWNDKKETKTFNVLHAQKIA